MKKEISITIRMDSETHRNLKILAAKEGKTAKDCIFSALDKQYPNWNKSETTSEK